MSAKDLPTTLPLPARVPPARAHPGIADRRTHRGWRDEALTVAAVVGAMWFNFVPAAWVVVDKVSSELLILSLTIPAVWTLCTTLQIATLRWLRVSRLACRDLAAVQCASAAVTGVAFSLACTSALDPYSERLGLDGGDAWGPGVYAAWNSVLVAAFLVWHRKGRQRQEEASQRLRAVQNAQFAARRSLVESHLQAVQARVDPQHFFDVLDAIQALYRLDVPRAEALFDELVVFLRAALPSLDSASSVLAREFDLAAACVRMHSLATGDEIVLAIAGERALQRLAFPPGLLLPLLRGVLQAETGARRIDLSARRESRSAGREVLALSITAGTAPDEPTLRQARAALRSLFGSAASLGCALPCDSRVTTHLRIDHGLL